MASPSSFQHRRSVYSLIMEKLKTEKIHFTLLDPDYDSPETIGKLAATAKKAGTDGIMVGGSTGLSPEKVEVAVRAIKASSTLPVILFPTSAGTLAPSADAIFFMSMLNSTDLRFVIGEQVMGAPIVKKFGIEPISMGYLVVEPGMAVGKVGKARPLKRDEPEQASSFALAAEYLGMKLVYLEAGSGAPEPVPSDMITKVKETISIPLMVGGGIRTAEQAAELSKSGADIVVTGTIVEESSGSLSLLTHIIKAVKS